jgi:hypothetical protein
MGLLRMLGVYALQIFGILMFCGGIMYMGFGIMESGNTGQIISIVIMFFGGIITIIGTYYSMKDKKIKENKPSNSEITNQP